MRDAAKEWVISAEMDLAVCERLLDSVDLTPMVAFHAQQCIEKLFKCLLEEHSEPIPRAHDLIRIYQIVLNRLPLSLEIETDLLEELSTIYLDSRYPSDLGLLPGGKPSLGDAKRYYTQAKALLQFVRQY